VLWIFLYAIVPPLAALLAWLSGSVVYWYGGYPLYWRMLFCTQVPAPFSTCGSYYDWTIFMFDTLFYTAIGYIILFGYAVYDLQRRVPRPTMSRGQSARPFRVILLCAIIPGIAALATWLAGFAVNLYGGFPLNWRMPCSLQAPTPIPTPTTGGSCAIYDWIAFDLDVLVYTTIGYGLLTCYNMYDRFWGSGTFQRKPA
jgi:hypothetical protein